MTPASLLVCVEHLVHRTLILTLNYWQMICPAVNGTLGGNGALMAAVGDVRRPVAAGGNLHYCMNPAAPAAAATVAATAAAVATAAAAAAAGLLLLATEATGGPGESTSGTAAAVDASAAVAAVLHRRPGRMGVEQKRCGSNNFRMRCHEFLLYQRGQQWGQNRHWDAALYPGPSK